MIGVFDSGLGGLSALRALSRALPRADLLYYADTAHLPIGEKSKAEICTAVKQALCFFSEQGASHVLLACGTASAVALPECKDLFAFKLYGIIESGARAAARYSPGGHIAVIATRATVATHAYAHHILALRPDARVMELSCPTLVTAAEAGVSEGVAKALSPLVESDADTLLLGCTHFPLLRGTIAALLPAMHPIDPAAQTGRALLPHLPKEGHGRRECVTTGDPIPFAARAAAVLGEPLPVRGLHL